MEDGHAELEDENALMPPGEDDNDSEDEDDGLFAWVINEGMDEDEEDDEGEEDDDDDEQPLDTEASESFELDSPAERSGHIAVVDRNIMYVWGGYKVRISETRLIQNHILQTYFIDFLFPFGTRMLKTTDSLTCTCRETRSGRTTWSQEFGNSCYIKHPYLFHCRHLRYIAHFAQEYANNNKKS